MIEDLHGGRRVARFEFHAYQLIRDAVIMPLDLDMVVNVRSDLFPLSIVGLGPPDVSFGLRQVRRERIGRGNDVSSLV